MNGYKLVPIELTDEMAEASGCEGCFRKSVYDQAQDMWTAMLNVSPAVQGEPVGWQFYQDGKWWNGDDRIKDHKKNTQEEGFRVRDVYAAQQLEEQHPTDSADVRLDKQCRQDVAAALGFIRGGNYAWSYLLQQIKDAVSSEGQQP